MMRQLVKSFCRTLALGLISGVASAQSLPDPTRPPLFGGIDGTGVAPTTGPVLQMLVQRQGKRPRALINGEWLEQGGVWGAYRVHQITSDSVILKNSAGRETVRLTPAVELRTAGPAKASPKTERARKVSERVGAPNSDATVAVGVRFAK